MTSERFANHPYAQCRKAHYDDGTLALWSYSTRVVEIDPEGWLMVNGLYSRTTISHIGWFMKELGWSYQVAKQLYQDGMKMNIYTGEVEKAE